MKSFQCKKSCLCFSPCTFFSKCNLLYFKKYNEHVIDLKLSFPNKKARVWHLVTTKVSFIAALVQSFIGNKCGYVTDEYRGHLAD